MNLEDSLGVRVTKKVVKVVNLGKKANHSRWINLSQPVKVQISFIRYQANRPGELTPEIKELAQGIKNGG